MKLEEFKNACERNLTLRPIWLELLIATLDLKDYAFGLAIQVRSGKFISDRDRHLLASLRSKFTDAVSRLVSKTSEIGLAGPPEGDLTADRVYVLMRQLPG